METSANFLQFVGVEGIEPTYSCFTDKPHTQMRSRPPPEGDAQGLEAYL